VEGFEYVLAKMWLIVRVVAVVGLAGAAGAVCAALMGG